MTTIIEIIVLLALSGLGVVYLVINEELAGLVGSVLVAIPIILIRVILIKKGLI